MTRLASSPDPADAFDAFELARAAGRRAAHTPLARLGRLAASLADGRGEIAWSIDGRSARRADGGRDLYLELRLAATVRMRCVRCLQPVDCPLAVARTLRLARTETQAEREDLEALDDDSVDVIAGSDRFAPLDLVEDEALLALPIAPRHVDCRLPADVGTAGEGAAGRGGDGSGDAVAAMRSPFAALALLRAALPAAGLGAAPDGTPGAGSGGEPGDKPHGGRDRRRSGGA